MKKKKTKNLSSFVEKLNNIRKDFQLEALSSEEIVQDIKHLLNLRQQATVILNVDKAKFLNYYYLMEFIN